MSVIAALFFIAWIVSPFACAAIAKRKNRSTVLSFLLGFLLGPIWLVIIAFSNAEGVDGLEDGDESKNKFPRGWFW